MIIEPTLSYKMIADAEPGELVRIRWGSAAALCIVLKQDKSTLCAVLRTPDTSRPFHYSIKQDDRTHCLSYGRGWVLDLTISDETFPGNNAFSEVSGAIHVTEGITAIELDRPPGNIQFTPGSFNLQTGDIVEVVTRKSSPVVHWRIWGSQSERSSPKSVPVFEMDVRKST